MGKDVVQMVKPDGSGSDTDDGFWHDEEFQNRLTV